MTTPIEVKVLIEDPGIGTPKDKHDSQSELSLAENTLSCVEDGGTGSKVREDSPTKGTNSTEINGIKISRNLKGTETVTSQETNNVHLGEQLGEQIPEIQNENLENTPEKIKLKGFHVLGSKTKYNMQQSASMEVTQAQKNGLVFQHVGVTMGDKTLLSDISGVAEQGKLLAIMGPSGEYQMLLNVFKDTIFPRKCTCLKSQSEDTNIQLGDTHKL